MHGLPWSGTDVLGSLYKVLALRSHRSCDHKEGVSNEKPRTVQKYVLYVRVRDKNHFAL
jgi:hypothetical protein